MKNFIKKVTIFVTIGVLSLQLLGCSMNKQVKPDKDPNKVVQDDKRTKQLLKEKELSDGKIYIKDNVLNATMVIKDDVKKEDIKKVVDKYSKELKEQYKDMKINIQAVQKGKNVANVTIDK